jgi:hypothetical protein
MVDPTPITDAGLETVERLEKAATPGPWTAGPRSLLGTGVIAAGMDLMKDGPLLACWSAAEIGADRADANAAFIAAARTEWPSLVHRLRTSEARVAELEALMQDYEQVLASKRENIRLIDVAMHGEDGAAKQASGCDLIEPARMLRARTEKAEAEVARLTEIRRIQLTHAFVAGVNWQADPRNCAGVKIVAGVAFADKLIANGDPMPESARPELTSDEVLRGALSDCQHDEASIEDTAAWIVEALDLAGWCIRAIPSASRPDPAQPGQSSAQPAAERECKICNGANFVHGADGLTTCPACVDATPPAAGSVAGKGGGS